MLFSSVPPGKCYKCTSNWSWPLLLTHFTLHYSVTILPTTLLNRSETNKLSDLRLSQQWLWRVLSCSLVKVNWCFGGTYRFNLQGPRVRQARNQHEAGWRWRWYVPLKCQLTLTGLNGIISQKTSLQTNVLFKKTKQTPFTFAKAESDSNV
jgi:hypothetical protein